MLEYGDSLRQFNTNVVEEDMDYLLTHCKKRIWIGNNQSQIFSKFGDRKPLPTFMNSNKTNH